MIRLTKATANAVTVTTTEKGTADHYLFEFQNLTTLGKTYCIQQDTSAFQNRYNQFEITEQASTTAADGEVELPEGMGKYWIYANTSSTNIDPTGLTVLETGMVLVTGTTVAPTEYDNNPNYIVYNG